MPLVRCTRTPARWRRPCRGMRRGRACRTCRANPAWMDFSMRSWKSAISILVSIALGACARAPGAFVLRSASLDAGTLTVRSDWRPDAQVLDALDHGIELPFVVTVQALRPGFASSRIRRHVQLRYFPLSRQYQLRDVEDATTRNYSARSLALQAMENLRLP